MPLYGRALAIGKKSEKAETISEFRENYLSKLAKLTNVNEFFVTDKMPHNFHYIPLICAAFPEAKIIHVKRDPAATCWSNFKLYFGTKDLGFSYDLHDVVEYFELYDDLMQIWRTTYGDRIYNLNYEKLTTDQNFETRELLKYLEINWEEACLEPHRNNRSIRTASQQQVRNKIYKNSCRAWLKYKPYLNGAFDRLQSK